MDGERPLVSIVIPSYRGAPRLPALLDELIRAFEEWNARRRRLQHDSIYPEVLIVDDGSPADEQRAVRALPAQFSGGAAERSAFDIQTLCLPHNRGQQYATIAGVSLARGELIATIDDDGAHPPAALTAMLEVMMERREVDLLYGAPNGAGGTRRRPAHRRIGTFLNNLLFRVFAGKPWSVPVTSFRVIRRPLVQRALAMPVSYAYLSAMLFSCRPRVAAFRYTTLDEHRESRYSIGRLAYIWWSLLFYWGPLKPLGRRVHPARPIDLPRGCD